MKTKIKYSFVMIYIILFSLVVCATNTYAKFTFDAAGVAWQTYFTNFEIIKEVFTITDDKNKTGSIFGPSIAYDKNNGYYWVDQSFFASGSGKWGDSYKFIEGNETTKYPMNSLQDVELNVSNISNNKVVVTFSLYYFALKPERDSTQVFFSLYCSSEHKDLNNEEDDTKFKTNNNVISGEFVVAASDDVLNNGFINTNSNQSSTTDNFELANTDNQLSDILATRIGGDTWIADSGYDFIINTINEYYTHEASINPYSILKLNSSQYGGESTANNLLQEFILDKDEIASFNLSVYFGSYGSKTTSSSNHSFIAALELYARPLYRNVHFNLNTNDTGSISYVTGNNYSSGLSDDKMYNGELNGNVISYEIAEGSFRENYRLPFPWLSRSGYTFNGWNTKPDGTGSEFTYLTKVTEDITVYAQWA